jgi:hypothetical protein
MVTFKGVAAIGGVDRQVEVSGNPSGRTVVRVDGVPMYDEKPFVARDTISFDVGGQAVTLTWRQLGLTRLECDVTSGGITATLARVMSSGGVVAPLDPATRRRVQARAGGAIALFAGIVMLWWSYDSLQRGRYDLKHLFAVPALIVGGLLGLLFPAAMTGSAGRTKQSVVMLLSLLLTLGLGYLFSRWFLATFAPR